jgi:hypothetical protein
MEKSSTKVCRFVELDVHAETIAVAVAGPGLAAYEEGDRMHGSRADADPGKGW